MTWVLWFAGGDRQYIKAHGPGDALRAFLGIEGDRGGWVHLVDLIPGGIMRVRYCSMDSDACSETVYCRVIW